ncbi:class I SAM-dependent methyltransferase [Bradyrhizobium sp. CB1650]|uniref:class I SAM-dependent methyltransferase n=1 Tax=Bradyrhizobium sp. CB1650 TaxID=3039153 RepID=UPI00243496BA|nr:class I SAM-dependent methyltransferase [Bradyrhizobium sp. CB1650]WGD51123.1 class I SAM-dependent methyltransferase [Bradyrhizobium sp. CB1650]
MSITTIAAAHYGDFSAVAKDYHKVAPSYAISVLRCLKSHVCDGRENFRTADVGAGTGKLALQLSELGFAGYAIEPNDAMREQGQSWLRSEHGFRWLAGSAEMTSLADASVDWVCMGTAFHCVDPVRTLSEFERVLRPGGFFTAIWNLTDDDLRNSIEEHIEELEPGLERAYRRALRVMDSIEDILLRSGQFGDCLRIEATNFEQRSRAQFMEAWKCNHDIVSQVSSARWQEILASIEDMIPSESFTVRSRTQSWTVRKVSES